MAVSHIGLRSRPTSEPHLPPSFSRSGGSRARAQAGTGRGDTRDAERESRDSQQHKQLITEAGRRLEQVRRELGTNKESVDELARSFATALDRNAPIMALNPQVLEGAWAANAPRLSEILADYD